MNLNRLLQNLRDQIDRIPTMGPLSRADARLWAQVETLRDAGELTARWLEGDMETLPGYWGRPAAETEALIPELVALNRAGFLTWSSQPGEGPVPYGGQEYWQRATVQGFSDSDVADMLQAASRDAGMETIRHDGAAKWRSDYTLTIPVSKWGDQISNESGMRPSRRALDSAWNDRLPDEVRHAQNLAIVDPVWGRNDLLWPTLTRELAFERDVPELDVTGAEGRERIEIDHREPELVPDADPAGFEQAPYEPEPVSLRSIERDYLAGKFDYLGYPAPDEQAQTGPQYLGYADGETVRDLRTGLRGVVRVLEDEEVGRYAEVKWADSFVSDELEVAIDNGLIRDDHGPERSALPDPSVPPPVLEAELVDAPELELSGAELMVEDDSPVTGLEANDQYAAELPGPELDNEPTANGETPELAVDEPSGDVTTLTPTATATPELEVDEPELDGDSAAAAPTSDLGTPEAGWVYEPDLSTAPTAPTEISPPSPPSEDKDAFTRAWVDELRSGNHRQAVGMWELPSNGISSTKPKKECTLQVAKNTFNVSLGELQDRYGHPFVGEVLERNDLQEQSFKKIADWIERTQLSSERQREREEFGMDR